MMMSSGPLSTNLFASLSHRRKLKSFAEMSIISLDCATGVLALLPTPSMQQSEKKKVFVTFT